jgi:hypothetical protein
MSIDFVGLAGPGEFIDSEHAIRIVGWEQERVEEPVPSVPVLANTGAMNQFIGAFEVTSKLTGHVYSCSFSHIWNAIATRHSDTIDAKFVVDGVGRIVGLAHSAFVAFREKSGRDLTDREGSFIAAEYLRERLEEEDERPLYDVQHDDVLRLINSTGIK